MNLIPEYLDVVIGVKLQLTPLNICALIVLGLAVAVVWKWYRTRVK